ncbi:MAG: peptidase M28, partial [Bacteroidetes bacterium]
ANFANSFVITNDLARKITGANFSKIQKLQKKINKKGKAKSMVVPANIAFNQKKKIFQLQGKNVIGVIEGTDDKLKNEYVFLTAHYDHIGEKNGNVYNGADDNGSGTSALLEIAQAFSEAKKNGWGPKRSVVVMLVSGEEKGLLGSKYYVENPLFPLENTIVDINVDMIGRVDEKHQGNPDYIYIIGADRLSSELHEINEEANQRFTQLELDYTYNAESDPNRYYYRSDHYNFAKKGIPAIFYFNGTHADYHRASDTIEKIEFETLHKRTNLIFYTAWELANRPERIVVDKK